MFSYVPSDFVFGKVVLQDKNEENKLKSTRVKVLCSYYDALVDHTKETDEEKYEKIPFACSVALEPEKEVDLVSDFTTPIVGSTVLLMFIGKNISTPTYITAMLPCIIKGTVVLQDREEEKLKTPKVKVLCSYYEDLINTEGETDEVKYEKIPFASPVSETVNNTTPVILKNYIPCVNDDVLLLFLDKDIFKPLYLKFDNAISDEAYNDITNTMKTILEDEDIINSTEKITESGEEGEIENKIGIMLPDFAINEDYKKIYISKKEGGNINFISTGTTETTEEKFKLIKIVTDKVKSMVSFLTDYFLYEYIQKATIRVLSANDITIIKPEAKKSIQAVLGSEEKNRIEIGLRGIEPDDIKGGIIIKQNSFEGETVVDVGSTGKLSLQSGLLAELVCEGSIVIGAKELITIDCEKGIELSTKEKINISSEGKIKIYANEIELIGNSIKISGVSTVIAGEIDLVGTARYNGNEIATVNQL